MDEVFKKLNYKAQKVVYSINYPQAFEASLASLAGDAIIKRSIVQDHDVEFVILFATKLQEVTDFTHLVTDRLKGDALVWIGYPKGTSKKYKCDFNRDSCWAAMKEFGFTAVRMVAIDDDWSAMRFRRSSYVKAGS